MATIIKNKSTLQLVGEFYDSDDRTFNLDNPDMTMTAAALAASINAIGTYAKDNNVLIGDKTGADFLKFKSAKRITNQSIIFDLT